MWGLQYKTGLWTTLPHILPISELGKTKYMSSLQILTTCHCWQHSPCCRFCNSSRFWLARRFSKHAATILTQEGAGAEVMKAGACEHVKKGMFQPWERHFWDALPKTSAGGGPDQCKTRTVAGARCQAAAAHCTRH